MNAAELKLRIEKETGLKVSVRKGALNGSLRGYVMFTPKKQGEVWQSFDYDYSRAMQMEMAGVDPNPNFFTTSTFSVYFGNEIYSEPKAVKQPKEPREKKVKKVKIEKSPKGWGSKNSQMRLDKASRRYAKRLKDGTAHARYW